MMCDSCSLLCLGFNLAKERHSKSPKKPPHVLDARTDEIFTRDKP